MQVIRKRAQLSNIVCLAKGFMYEVEEGGPLGLVSGRGGSVALQAFFTLYENIEEESSSS